MKKRKRMDEEYGLNFNQELDKAKASGVKQDRTDAWAQGDGYIGIDEIDRLRRERLKHQTK
jgi:hypothetical protein